MKKMTFALVLFSLFTVSMIAQRKTVDISSLKAGQVSAKYSKVINLETKDTVSYVYLGFQNAKYSSISDIKSIMLSRQEDLKEFIKDLKIALPEINTKQNIDWTKNNYGLTVYDFSNGLYLREKEKNGSGYTILQKKDVEKLIIWLESIDFGKG